MNAHRFQRRLVAAMFLLALAPMLPAQSLTQVTGFGSNPGNLQMFKYVPASLPANAPLVVALHGCSQSAGNYDDETGWVLLANRWQFALVLPQQQSGNNASRCFNWFETGDIARGQGEALSIRQMVERMRSDHGSDPARIYVTGLSAGAAMAAVMLATYPDVFAGGAIVAGIPYRCGTGLTEAFSCMSPGKDLTPAQWGDRVRAASGHAGPWPIVSIWHGDADYTVRPLNLAEGMQQWTNVHGIGQTPAVQDTVGGHAHAQYRNAAGRTVVETYAIAGMGHGTPVDPGSGETQCGQAGAFILDVNVCSSYYIARFWGLDGGGGPPGGGDDVTPPTVTLTSPVAGATVFGTVTLSAVATDNVAVTGVEFLVDGALIGAGTSGTGGSWTLAWNTASVADGAHTLSARARDAAENLGTSGNVAVTVSQPPGGGSGSDETFSNRDGNGDYYDLAGWSGDFAADAANATPGPGASQSAYGYASSGIGCATGLRTKSLSRTVTLPASPRLSYQRRLDLRANANIFTYAYFRVLVNGAIVDEHQVTFAAYADTAWQPRSNISLAGYAGQAVTLRFEAGAYSNVCLESWAKARIDDIAITQTP